MPTDRYANVELKPSASVPSIRLWDARIALRSTAVLAEEPIQVRRTILGITAKVVDVGAAEIAEQQCAFLPMITAIVLVSIVGERKERIELCAHWWNDATYPVCLAGPFRA